MNFKRFHESKNLFDESTLLNGYYDTTSSYQYYPNDNYRCFSLELTAGTYTIFAKSDVLTIRLLRVSSSSLGANPVNLDNRSYTFTLPATETIYVSLRNSTTTNDFTGLTVMLNEGSTALPYEPYSAEVWTDSHYIMGTDTDTLTLPAVIYPNASSITVGIKGNTTQSGTPSPSNPVDVNGTGERTGNLWSNNDATLSEWISSTGEKTTGSSASYGCTFSIPYNGENSYTIKYHGIRPYSYSLVFYDNNGDFIIREHIANPDVNGDTITVPTGTASVTAQVATNVGTTLTREMLSSYEIMLNSGSTPLPYELFGYKIPILTNSTTTPVYLGEVQTERQIKKLVFDGTENWKEGTSNYYILIDVSGRGEGVPNSVALSTHTENGVEVNGNGTALFFKKSVFVQSSLADFKTYLAAQYAAGTPVTVWYVLAEPETGIVNEPLMKIGTYADTLTTSIPCTAGENTLDVQTTVQPSEVTATFEGWHAVSAAHERDNGAWT